MSKRLKKTISIFTSITTALWLSGVMMLVPMAASAVTIVDGDVIRNPSAEGLAQLDVYIVKLVGDKMFKRLVLSPHVFESYGHLEWGNVKEVDQATMDSYTLSDLVREINDKKVYRLTADGDTGTKEWLNMTPEEFVADGNDWDAIYTINSTDRDAYTTSDDDMPPVVSDGTLTISLAADTPAAAIVVQNAARHPFTKINLTANGGDVTVDSLTIERTGVGQDSAFSSLDVIDGDDNLPIDVNSKTLNSAHKSNFNKDFTIADGTTKSIILAGNMASSLTNNAGETPSLTLESISLKGDGMLNASLPITGNRMTVNSTITIGTATIQRGAFTNATSTAIQVGKTDYTFFSFQVQAGSAEKVKFSQVKVYQEGSASLGTDLTDLELLQDGTKIADGVVATSKYVNFAFDPITLNKGQIKQFQVKATVADGSSRTVILGIYRNTDLLVSGLTYGYNITPTYSSTGSSSNKPVLSDNQFTISNGTFQVTRSSTVGAGNIGVANDQILGAYKFTVKGEEIDVSALTLTIASTSASQTEDAITGVELVDSDGNVVAGPTDVTNNALTVAWTDTFTVPVGDTVYRVRADLATDGGWASDNTVTVSFTPSAMTATGVTTGNSIAATPSSSVSASTQTVKAATLTVTKNTLPATSNIIVDQKNVVLSSWSFDATNSGEDVRITSILWASRGAASTNTDALTTFIDENKNAMWDSGTDTALSPIQDAVTTNPATSTHAFDTPIIITKGTSVHIAIKGDKDSVTSNDTENWGLADSAGANIVAYGVSTGNSITETLTPDHGPTLTTKTSGELTIETEGNPSSSILLAGSAGNTFAKVKLSSKYEDLRLDELMVRVADGGYAFSAPAGDNNDIVTVSLLDGTTVLGTKSISTANTKFTFNAGDLTILKGKNKIITIQADMSTIDPDADNAPGTANADLKIGFGGANGVKTTGLASNTVISGSSEVYRDATSSAMVLRVSKPTVTLPTAGTPLGAATTLISGTQNIFAFKVTAPAAGEVLLYRTTFVFATSGSGMTLTNVSVKDQNGNTIKSAANPTSFDINGNTEYYYTTTFNNPDFSVDDTDEAIRVPAGESRTFTVVGQVAGVSTGETLSTFLVGDTASTTAEVNNTNFALATTTGRGWPAPTTDMATEVSNFIWSDNYRQWSISGTGGNNATTAAQWYNGHLVPGLENSVTTTVYVIGSN